MKKQLMNVAAVTVLLLAGQRMFAQWITSGGQAVLNTATSVRGSNSTAYGLRVMPDPVTGKYIDIGNSSMGTHANIKTNCDRFFLDKPTYIATTNTEGTISSFNTGDLILSTGLAAAPFATPRITVKNATGNVGINYSNPLHKLHVDGDLFVTGAGGSASAYFGDLNTQAEWGLEYDGGGLNFWKPWGSNNFGNHFMFIKDNGFVGIGTNNPTAKLTVHGGKVLIGDPGVVTLPGTYGLYVENGILAEKVRVAVKNSTNWADYVFEDSYQLRSLSEVEAFVQKNKHLPEVPSANEMVEKGMDVIEINSTLLKKIEELTLYMIELDKAKNQQDKMLQEQADKIAELSKELEARRK